MTTFIRLCSTPRLGLGAVLAAATLLAGCAFKMPGRSTPPAEPPAGAPTSSAPAAGAALASNARTPRDYRRDAATQLYAHNKDRIYRGQMPPLLYAVGVLQVEINARGDVAGISWMRAPTQAPEVMAEIERTVRAAAPYPRPVHLGRVTYTDTWLWHRSGKFQLDTLTEGQM